MGTDLIKAVLEGQAGLDACRDAMSEALRGVMIQALMDQMQSEVTTLCGPYYDPTSGATQRRAGSALGQFWLNGSEQRFARPRVRQKQGREVKLKSYAAARKALSDLKRFVAGKNQKALESVDEAGEELIALHLLEAPSTLQVSLLSTNAIENPIRNFRAKTRRVTRWRPQSDMSERWTAYAMLTAEQGFHRIYGYHDLPALLRALGWTEENMARVTGTVTPDQNRGDGTPQKDH